MKTAMETKTLHLQAAGKNAKRQSVDPIVTKKFWMAQKSRQDSSSLVSMMENFGNTDFHSYEYSKRKHRISGADIYRGGKLRIPHGGRNGRRQQPDRLHDTSVFYAHINITREGGKIFMQK